MTTETNGIVHDLKSTEFKALIERAAGLNFRIEDSKSDFDKLFAKDAEEFVKQLQRMAANLNTIASSYKKELDAAKKDGLTKQINSLDADIRQQLIDDLVAKGIIPKPIHVEIERTSKNKPTAPREIKTITILNIGGSDYKFNHDKRAYITSSFIDLDEEEVKNLFALHNFDTSVLALKGNEGKAAKVDFIEKHKKK